MYRLPCLANSATCRRIAVRSLVSSRSRRHPALARSTLTRRMTSVSWPARPGATGGAAFFVVCFGAGFLGERGVAAVRVGEGVADGGAVGDGLAGRAAPPPGAPPPAPGAR